MICDYKEHNYYGKGFKIQIIIHDSQLATLSIFSPSSFSTKLLISQPFLKIETPNFHQNIAYNISFKIYTI